MKVVAITSAKKKQERKQYAALVLKTFDDMQHQDKREQKQQAAEVRRKARNQF